MPCPIYVDISELFFMVISVIVPDKSLVGWLVLIQQIIIFTTRLIGYIRQS